MKKFLKIIFLSLSVLSLGMMFTACGNRAMADAAGTYKGQYTKWVGGEARETDEEFHLVLNKDGSGKHYRNTLEIDITWKLDDEAFTMNELGLIDYTGTLKDGTLDIFNGDPADVNTAEYVYVKE